MTKLMETSLSETGYIDDFIRLKQEQWQIQKGEPWNTSPATMLLFSHLVRKGEEAVDGEQEMDKEEVLKPMCAGDVTYQAITGMSAPKIPGHLTNSNPIGRAQETSANSNPIGKAQQISTNSNPTGRAITRLKDSQQSSNNNNPVGRVMLRLKGSNNPTDTQDPLGCPLASKTKPRDAECHELPSVLIMILTSEDEEQLKQVQSSLWAEG
ncbi:hypothetical protein SKAU_G00415400 [Synaphobranchus kaupii]|uniref:Uncharacterized protein n=1 Tax=Synaphobranchus kaupii TaxID=118154 RepID=A0A9Q1E7E4_SYNKA|nr:hypothetical protein SKAU_G00415400 [Synaphobranchus kaupii]